MDNRDEPLISVVICTHNPNIAYLSRVLAALQVQTLPRQCWELLLVDNASEPKLCDTVDLQWHPNARHVCEKELGLTPARLRGIAESRGDVIVFVDDDNILAADYLEEVGRIAKERPDTGAWGGNVTPEFESPAPAWTQPYWGLLAIREVVEDRWSTDAEDYASQPCGAGMCVRRVVAKRYEKETVGNPLKTALDRKGDSLSSCGDSDLAQTSLLCGLGFGVFEKLKLTHIIPARRLEEDYLVKLAESMAVSLHLLRFIRTRRAPQPKVSIRSVMGHLYRQTFLPEKQKKFYNAKRNAARIAARKINEINEIKGFGPAESVADPNRKQ